LTSFDSFLMASVWTGQSRCKIFEREVCEVQLLLSQNSQLCHPEFSHFDDVSWPKNPIVHTCTFIIRLNWYTTKSGILIGSLSIPIFVLFNTKIDQPELIWTNCFFQFIAQNKQFCLIEIFLSFSLDDNLR